MADDGFGGMTMTKSAPDRPMRLFTAILGAVLPGLCAVAATISAAAASGRAGEENVLTCPIRGQDREASISIAGTRAIYRYGRPGQAPELTLSGPLADLDYRREDGAGDTIDEIATFTNGDTAYRFAAGFRDGLEPDRSALRPFGLLTVSRAGKTLATLACDPDRIDRVHDRLLARMRAIGRERTTDGVAFPNYPIRYPPPAGRSPPCEADSNVDTCWSSGVAAARGGDLRGARDHYDMSCDAGLITAGCYEAGKLYLHNRQLRDYARARQRFARVCDGDDPGQAPYACKYLGWMHLTGTGAERDPDKAWHLLAHACFPDDDSLMIDPEGCHFLARAILETRARSPRRDAMADYLAYLALAQACTDGAATVCDEARALHRREAARGAAWIGRCDRDAAGHGEIASCAGLARIEADYDAARAMRKQLRALYREAVAALG